MLFLTSIQLSEDLLLASVLVVAFFVQLALSLKVNKRFVRLLPVILCLIATVVLVVSMYTAEGWDALGYLLLAIFSALIFIDFVAALIVGGIIRLIKR